MARSFTPESLQLPVVPHRLPASSSQIEFATNLGRYLEEHSFDVVHDMGVGWHGDVLQPHSGCMESLYLRSLAAWPLAMRPAKYALDALSSRKRRHRQLERLKFGPGGSLVVAISQRIAKDLEQRYAVVPERIRLVRHGVNLERFAQVAPAERERTRASLAIRAGELVGMFIAKNLRLKGIQPLLRAMASTTGRQAKLRMMIVGGKRNSPWRSYARLLGVEKRVIWIEPVGDAAPLYAAADFLVHPTFYDAFGLVVLEAAATGLPVITTRNNNGVAELLEHGKSALLIDSASNHAELAVALGQMGDAALRERLGSAARQFALRHKFERNVEEIVALYEEVASRKAGHGSAVSHPRRAA